MKGRSLGKLVPLFNGAFSGNRAGLQAPAQTAGYKEIVEAQRRRRVSDNRRALLAPTREHESDPCSERLHRKDTTSSPLQSAPRLIIKSITIKKRLFISLVFLSGCFDTGGLARCFVRCKDCAEGRGVSRVGPRQGHIGTGISPRASRPRGSGAGHKSRSAQIKPSNRQNVSEGIGANGSGRFAPPVLKYWRERVLSPKRKRSSSPYRSIPSPVGTA